MQSSEFIYLQHTMVRTVLVRERPPKRDTVAATTVVFD